MFIEHCFSFMQTSCLAVHLPGGSALIRDCRGSMGEVRHAHRH